MSKALVLCVLLAGCVKGDPGNVPPDPWQKAAAPTPALDVDGPPVGPPIVAELTSAPTVPPPIHREHPAKVIVTLEVKELTMRLADGVDYVFWTFGGSVPGRFIRVRQGDQVEFHLQNHPDNKLPHNIDLHAVTGPGGGASASFAAPGHEVQFDFQALNPGLYVYHCATAPVPMHVANGMYGLILVEPAEGLPPVDREYYVMQGDFYTTGEYHAKGLQGFDMQKGIAEEPTYIVFNGAEGALTGEHALTAKVGEKVRIFFGDGGPNMTSSFHVIGEIFDRVYAEGGMKITENVQTTMVPAGGSTIVEFTVQVPGNYILVDHSLFRAFNKGAVGMLTVTGPDQKQVFSGKVTDSIYVPGQAKPQVTASVHPAGDPGQAVFASTCAACHQPTGAGLAAAFPPLAGSDFLKGQSKEKLIGIVLNGLNGPITVNGATYNGAMPPWSHLSDDDIASVLNYVLKSWGNDGRSVTPADVATVRAGKTAEL